ncbi:VOC family protein [Phytohabitans sp. LJ34]|uniref:VOC family protein n=1 Tax=Phytohabitans sp. LJ34 TaxID=3452217 RepID=UPI003F8BD385
MSLRGFATLNFWADDLAAAATWYTEFLGVAPYFNRPGYVEFRLGDHQAELGIIDRRYAPAGVTGEPGGAIMYWHVDDLAATVERLIALGAREFEPITPRGDSGFVTGSVVDPFGNVLGVMYNPHYVDVHDARVS